MNKLFFLMILFFVTLTFFIVQLIEVITKKDFRKKAFMVSQKNYKERKEVKEKIRMEEGNTKDKSFINYLDMLLERSFNNKITWINGEVYIAINLILSLIVFFVSKKLSGDWIIGVFLIVILLLVVHSFIYIISGINYQKVDKEILTFVNIIENYAATNDDIVSIMGKTYPHLNEPLKGYIKNFYNEATTIGDVTRAFRALEHKIENEKIKDIIRNIEICSRHEANYREIIQDTRGTLKDYLKAKEERKAIINTGRLEILMCLSMSAIMVFIFNSFVTNLMFRLKSTPIGNGILLYCIVVMAITIWNMIAFDKRGQ